MRGLQLSGSPGAQVYLLTLLRPGKVISSSPLLLRGAVWPRVLEECREEGHTWIPLELVGTKRDSGNPNDPAGPSVCMTVMSLPQYLRVF